MLCSRKSLQHFILTRAGERTRTVNLLLTRQLLYQLSYASKLLLQSSLACSAVFVL